MPFQMTGVAGTLRSGGRVAATLGAWSFAPGPGFPDGPWEVRATLAGRDDYWLPRVLAGRQPFDLVLTLTRETWRWRGQPSGGLTITSGGGEPPTVVTITGQGEPDHG